MVKKRKVKSKAAKKAEIAVSAKVLRSENAARKKAIKSAIADFKMIVNAVIKRLLADALV